MKNKLVYSLLFGLAMTFAASGQDDVIYDESKVPEYTLPPFFKENQQASAANWKNRRAEIMDLFKKQVYGQDQAESSKVTIGHPISNILIEDEQVRLLQYSVSIAVNDNPFRCNLLIFLPATMSEPVPVFLGLNFMGNHTIHENEQILIPRGWVSNHEEMGVVENRAGALGRGKRAHRWPVADICDEGFGLATIYYGDFDPDFDDQFENGVHGLLQAERDESSWGSIATWAWGLSRAMDALQRISLIDHHRVAVFGHSRLGKTSLWAGAIDERFALVISNNSGCGGAALSRRRFGEKVSKINTNFPHWFAKNFHQYNDNEAALPVDQHMLLALSAPRPLYVASAVEDRWADPRGEYLSLHHASEVYQLFDQESQLDAALPDIDQPKWAGKLGYHIRSGKHDVTLYDWQQYMAFAKKQFED